MSAAPKDRAFYARRCKEVEDSYLKLADATGKDYCKQIYWLRKWSMTILDTRCDLTEYNALISKQESDVAYLIRKHELSRFIREGV